MYSLNKLKLNNIITIFFYTIFLSNEISFCDELIDMKKLSLYDSYFVVLDRGLYLYKINHNIQILDCALIHEFKTEIIYLKDKVILNELTN